MQNHQVISMPSYAGGFTPVDPALAIVRNPLVASPKTPLITVIEQLQGDKKNCLAICHSTQEYGADPAISDLHLEAQTTCIIAVDHNRVVGILTQRDVLRLLHRQPQDLLRPPDSEKPPITLGDVMSQPIVVLHQSRFTDLAAAIELLQRHRVRHLPIVNDDQGLVGLVTCDTLQYARLVDQVYWSHHQRLIISDIEQRYANLVDAAPVGIFHADAEGRHTYVNERWHEITGLSDAEAMGLPWQELIFPADLPLVKAESTQAALEQRPFRCEFRLQHPDKQVLWVYGQMVTERDTSDAIVGHVGTFTDITNHKQFEDALQQSNRQNRNIISLIPDYLFRIDVQGRYREIVTYRDDISLVTKGVHPVGHSMPEVLPIQVAEWQMGYLHEALATGKLGVYEQPIDMGDHIRWEEVRVIKSGADEALFMVRDISDRKQAEQALQALVEGTAAVTGKDFFTSLVRHIASALQVDHALVSELCEEELQTLAFWKKDKLHPCYQYKFAKTPCEYALKQGLYYCESDVQQYFSADTDLIHHLQVESYLGITLRNARGIPIGILCILHRHALPDPTHAKKIMPVFAARAAAELERQRATASLKHLNQQLETKVQERTQALQHINGELARATRQKDEFLANMSHELRTPLNAILGLAEALQEQVFGSLNETQIKTLNTIETSGQHLLALINDILDVAKIEAGKMELRQSLTDVAELCRSSCLFVAQQAMKKGIQLETHLGDNLPHVRVDERRMRQVLINLLSNAVKFTPPGGQVTVNANFHRVNPSNSLQKPLASPIIQISITDTGIGIAPEKQQHLFQPFVQIDSALNRQYQGTGLGLALVKRIVQLHGGQVGVISQPGKGSCFTIQLPCQVIEGQTLLHKSDRAEGQLHPAQPARTAAHILIAEDNAANMATMTGYLKARGYHISQARNGREALQRAEAHPPDLILMDIQMPGVDGLEAIQKIRQSSRLKRVPIVAVTALALTTDQDRCLSAGANRYLTKPIKLKQLAIAVQQLLSL